MYSSGSRSSVASDHTGSSYDIVDRDLKPGVVAPAFQQSYDVIKRQLLATKTLFEDPFFPAGNESLFFSRAPPGDLVWKRPKEIVVNPQLFVDGASKSDIAQGMLGDCWLLAAMASITEYESLLYQVVPPDQSFDEDYCGMFRFRFWQYGKWEEVVIDDRLPTFHGRLLFLHSNDSEEFWSALLEKAYAKLHGSYEALKGGQTSEAMEDFTGGVTETHQLEKEHENLLRIMTKAMERQSLMSCSIMAESGETEAKLPNGLVKGHAYSVTGIHKVSANLGSGNVVVDLVRIRNPWGNESKWLGAWSDCSAEWHFISDAEKESLGLTFEDDGQFWMSFKDFLEEFTRLEICMLSPDSTRDNKKRAWEINEQVGFWQRKVSAGGCINFQDTFFINPQYKVKLENPDYAGGEDKCTLIVALLQKHRRKIRKLGAQNLNIGFEIFKLENDASKYMATGRLNKAFFCHHKPIASSGSLLNVREVTGHFFLPPAEYVIIPSTFKANEEGEFLLRLISEKPTSSNFIDMKTDIKYMRKEVSEGEFQQMTAKFQDCFGTDEEAEIDAFELQQILTEAFKTELTLDKEFSLEATRSLIALTESKRCGKLGFAEFKDMWSYLIDWQKVYKECDLDKSGDMDALELRDALSKIGFRLSTPVLTSLTLHYSNKEGKINFDDFIHVCCKVLSCCGNFIAFEERRFTVDNYIQSVIYT